MIVKIKEKSKSILTSYPVQRLLKATITTVFVTVIVIVQEDMRYAGLAPIVEVIRGMVFARMGWNLDR